MFYRDLFGAPLGANLLGRASLAEMQVGGWSSPRAVCGVIFSRQPYTDRLPRPAPPAPAALQRWKNLTNDWNEGWADLGILYGLAT